jgi:hypothetical protein
VSVSALLEVLRGPFAEARREVATQAFKALLAKTNAGATHDPRI